MASWVLTLRSARVFMRYMKLSHWPTAMPSWRLTACASKLVECGTLMAPDPEPAPCNAIASVLLHTTRTEVGMAIVARVPSHDVASSR